MLAPSRLVRSVKAKSSKLWINRWISWIKCFHFFFFFVCDFGFYLTISMRFVYCVHFYKRWHTIDNECVVEHFAQRHSIVLGIALFFLSGIFYWQFKFFRMLNKNGMLISIEYIYLPFFLIILAYKLFHYVSTITVFQRKLIFFDDSPKKFSTNFHHCWR